MSERAPTRMVADEFLEWGLHQDLRYELIDGVPMAMAGAKRRHDRITANAHGMLFVQLRGKRCIYFTADTAVRIPAGNVRRPDAGIDCGTLDDDDATAADAPYLVLEVLSPSTRDFDLIDKLEEYKSVPTLQHIVIVDPDAPQVYHWSRVPADGWVRARLEGTESVVTLPEIECTLDLATLYQGLTFRPQPRLVQQG